MKPLITQTTVFDMVFPDLVLGENTVLCPFHSEHTPSMHINTVQKIYHCFGCGAHGSENDFVSQYFGIGPAEAGAFKTVLTKSLRAMDYVYSAQEGGIYKSNYTYEKLVEMGIPESLLEELYVGCEIHVEDTESGPELHPDKESTRLVFPIILNGHVLDTRAYTMDKTVRPKTLSKPDAPAGLVLPAHLWTNDRTPTVVCEGEKDMVFARAHGYNAITLGGANNVPTLMKNLFSKRTVYIVYDNDNAGRAGAKKLANMLYNVVDAIYIADIGKYVKEEKEDITDFFYKYKYTNKEFDEMLNDAVPFDADAREAFIKETYPNVCLNEASTKYLGKTVRSNIQVVATFEDQYSVPGHATFQKTRSGGKEEANKHAVGDTEAWSLGVGNLEDVLVLADNNLKKAQICENLKGLIGWGNEEHVTVNYGSMTTIFKACVADTIESVVAQDVKRTEFVCYSKQKLEAGKNYQLVYRIVPHPYKGQQQVLIVQDVKESDDMVSSFQINPETIALLAEFQKYKFKELAVKQKAYVGFDVDNRLLEFIDLWYHTPKAFNFGHLKNIKGFLDGLIVAESRVGKSSTAQALSQVYKLGAIASLAGSAATPAGLLGGSVRSSSSSQIRPGLIPRCHNRAIIFEELAKAKYSLIPELTDVRSSGLVRINRSTGDLTLPAAVRMLFLTNPKVDNESSIRPIIAYPNGIEVVKPLIGTAEDIARFDFIYVLGEVPTDIDPLWNPPEGFTEKQLRARLCWVWSRTPEQVQFAPTCEQLIVNEAKDLYTKYNCSVKIFSTETWKKLARLSIAIAGYMVSTDFSYENIIVKPEHVKIAKQLLESVYNNPTFKLKEFVDEERKQTTCTTSDFTLVKELLTRYPSVIEYLERHNNIAKNTLHTVSGMELIAFNELLKHLAQQSFITLTQYQVFPTVKLLTALNHIRKSTSSGEPDE